MNSTGEPSFSLVDAEAVRAILFADLAGCLRVTSDAYLAYAEGAATNPASVFLSIPEQPKARIIALPAHLTRPSKVSGIKWIASYPDNIEHGLPRASAVIILNRADTGFPFACMEGSIVSAARTAASAVLAANHLCDPERLPTSLGIIGAGLIARYVYRFLIDAGWRFDALHVYDSDLARAKQFAHEIEAASGGVRVCVEATTQSVMLQTGLVVFTTTAKMPHVHEPRLLAHRPVILHLSLRDLGPFLLREAYNVVDDRQHIMQAQTSVHVAAQMFGSDALSIATLAEVMRGQSSVDRKRPIIFSPFGLGVLDVAVGHWIYQRAEVTGALRAIPGFFAGI